MKKQTLIITVILVGGIVIGCICGSLVTRSIMQNKMHDQVVQRLNEMSNTLQDKAAVFYAENAYNVYGEFLPSSKRWYDTNPESTIDFVADFLSTYDFYLIRNGLKYSKATEEMIRKGKAIPQATNTQHYINSIKFDAQSIAESNGEQFRKRHQ